jgi:hypothetical protein
MLAGAAYVFEWNGSIWVERQRLAAGAPAAFDFLGSSVDISGATIVVGATGGGATGEAHVFVRSAGAWIEQQTLSSGGGPTYAFGSATSVSGNTIAVSATGGNAPYGAVFVFERAGSTWSPLRTFTGTPHSVDIFAYYGLDIDLDGDTLVVGDFGADDALPADPNCLSGAVHLYTRTGPGTMDWSSTRLQAGVPVCGENLARGVAVDGDTIVAGAPEATGAALQSGACYVFARRAPGTTFCAGVGCPCGNDDAGAGCTHSGGSGASLAAQGSTSVGADDLRVRASALPPNRLAFFIAGAGQAGDRFGDGLRCVAMPLTRYVAQSQNSGAGATVVLDRPVAGAAGAVTVGVSLAFQCVFRDGPGSPCGTRLNATNAILVTFTP